MSLHDDNHHHTSMPYVIDTDRGDVAEAVLESMRKINLPEEVIKEFHQSDLLEMYNVGGYTTTFLLQNAQRVGLERCLKPALLDILVPALDYQRGKLDSFYD